jgi:hypothetical protein
VGPWEASVLGPYHSLLGLGFGSEWLAQHSG